MSTILNTNGTDIEVPVINEKVAGKFYIITAEWNSEITHALREGAAETLKKGGVAEENIKKIKVPGTVELVNAAAKAIDQSAAGVIVIGCVIRGDTPHFDYVCQHVTEGVAILNSKGKSPVIFGVLTVNTLEQAQERAGGKLGNKGSEAGAAAIEMANLSAEFESLKL